MLSFECDVLHGFFGGGKSSEKHFKMSSVACVFKVKANHVPI